MTKVVGKFNKSAAEDTTESRACMWKQAVKHGVHDVDPTVHDSLRVHHAYFNLVLPGLDTRECSA